MLHKDCQKAMTDEISALNKNKTWILIDLPTGKKLPRYKWIYTIKFKANKSIDIKKAKLVAKSYNQPTCIDYMTLSPVAKLNSIKILLSLATTYS